MASSKKHPITQLPIELAKTPTGIVDLDEITLGGLPKGRPTLICGEAGAGKTLFSIEFIVRGALLYNGYFYRRYEQEENCFAEG